MMTTELRDALRVLMAAAIDARDVLRMASENPLHGPTNCRIYAENAQALEEALDAAREVVGVNIDDAYHTLKAAAMLAHWTLGRVTPAASKDEMLRAIRYAAKELEESLDAARMLRDNLPDD